MTALEDAVDDEQVEAILQEMDGIAADLGDKAEAYARILRNKQAEAEAFKAEKERLAKCQKAAEAVADRLKRRMMECMEHIGASEIQTGIGLWAVRKNPPSCKVLDESAVPAEYRIAQPDKIDKATILRHFKETGEIVPGTDIERTTGIRFK